MIKIMEKFTGRGKDESFNGTESGRETDAWLGGGYCEEGQLAIDVYQTPENLIIKSTIAGAKPEDLDISLNNDMLTIRGKREVEEEIEADDYLYRECYWGSFSRSIILPLEVEPAGIKAFIENGVLTVSLPKKNKGWQIPVEFIE